MGILERRIKKRREELGYSQDELAQLLGYKSRSSINKIELGKSDISSAKLSEFAEVLKCSVSYLLGHESDLSAKDSKNEAAVFVRRLKYLRSRQKLTQQELANNLGVSLSLIAECESGRKIPNIKILCLMAKYFDVTTDYLCGLSDSEEERDKIEYFKHTMNEILRRSRPVNDGVPPTTEKFYILNRIYELVNISSEYGIEYWELSESVVCALLDYFLEIKDARKKYSTPSEERKNYYKVKSMEFIEEINESLDDFLYHAND